MAFFKNFGRLINMISDESIFNYIDSLPLTVNIREGVDFVTTVNRNRLWYRGDGAELEQFYKQLNRRPNTTARETFWGAECDGNDTLDKYHYPIAKQMVDILTGIVTSDLNKTEFAEESDGKLWEEIAKDNKFKELLEESLKVVLSEGDGAFKITFDTNLTKYPILEFYESDKVEFNIERGRVKEVLFKTLFEYNDRVYVLYETYGHGYINYSLSLDGKVVPLDTIPQTSRLTNTQIKSGNMLALPFMIYKSPKFKGRGESIYDSKIDAFDYLDEVVSLWGEAVVLGKAIKTFRESSIPRDKNNGTLLNPSKFNKFYVVADEIAEDSKNKPVDYIQPDIPDGAYYNSFTHGLEWAMQGILSPSTLAIDTKKITDPNASYERQMEKTTIYTRNKIVNTLTEVLENLLKLTVSSYKEFYGESCEVSDVEILFGEYSTPSFEQIVETVVNAINGGAMSTRTALDEIYGDTKTDEWKDEEYARIVEESGR